MAKLLKLHISGIRSFGPYEDQAQQLKFASPLTLIVGQNGCGKTTIIEAIKYACSGEIPAGSNNGQAFVNDPKMSGSTSTKGQIKLKILDGKGNEVTVCRVIEVSLARAGLKFSTKSASIRTVTPDGQDASISGRCADVTTECCQIMNVSKAVLDNVIFCHQENSAWPLDEGKKLKEKFDEIFDAQRYNKCADVFRKEVKEKETGVKVLKVELSGKLEKKQCVEKAERSLRDKKDKLQTLEDDIRVKSEKLDPIRERLEEILDLEKVLGNLQLELTTKEATKQGVVEEQNTIKRSIPEEFQGTDEELRQTIVSFKQDREKDRYIIAELERKKTDIESTSKNVSNAINETQTDVGKLNQEKFQNEKRCEERKKLMAKARVDMDTKIASEFESNDEAKQALRELHTILESSQMSLTCLLQENDLEEVNLQKTVDQARANTLQIKHDIATKQKELTQIDRNTQVINTDLHNISISQDLLTDCDKKIENIDKTLFNLDRTFQETQESQRNADYKKNIEDMEHDLESLEVDYRILQQNDITEGKLETEKTLIREKQKEINRIKTKHCDKLKLLFAEAVPEVNLKEIVLKEQAKAELEVKHLMERIQKKQRDVTTLEVQHQNQVEKIQLCEKELKTKQEKLSQVCHDADFNDFLERTYQKKEKLQVDKGQYSSARIIYDQFVKKFEESSPSCPICETSFHGKGDAVKKIISTLKSKLNKLPQELARVESELQKEENLYSNLQQLTVVNEEMKLLTTEKLPQLKQCLQKIDNTLSNANDELENMKLQMSEPQKILEVCKYVISDVASLVQNQADVEKSQRTVQSLNDSLVQVSSNKSKAEIEAEIDLKKSEISNLRKKQEAHIQRITRHKDRVQQLMQERSVHVTKQSNFKMEMQRVPGLQTQKREFETKKTELTEEIQELRMSLCAGEAELRDAIDNKKQLMDKNKQDVQEERNKIAAHTKIIQGIEILQNEIDQYLSGQTENKLLRIKDKLRELKNKEEALNEKKNKVMEEISAKQEGLDKGELNFLTLQQNVILREKKILEATLGKEIQALRRQIGGHDCRSLYEEKRRLVTQREEFDKQINNIAGEKTELTNTIEELRQDLALEENRHAHDKYMSKLYELKVTECVVQDLYKFIVGLEKSVLDFHKTKMTQINKKIRELWRDVYRGNDIDYIEIKTEYASAAAKKRAYNYKVVQVKKGIELDMRGRCSAGQKVLACLIIRMALAETLSANCGILALDEPTTNLDRENIHSLSDTLSRIVNTRQGEKNFQLLVITHDEEFVNTLTRAQGVSHFNRVERNDDGFSVIKKEYTL